MEFGPAVLLAEFNQLDAGGADINTQVRVGFPYSKESHAKALYHTNTAL